MPPHPPRSGHRCGSPALRQEIFCFFHHTTRKPVSQQEREAREHRQEAAQEAAGRKSRLAFTLPHPDERSAIQNAIAEVLLRLADTSGYDEIRMFRRAFKVALGQVQAVYREARVKPGSGGLTLWHSPPPVKRKLFPTFMGKPHEPRK